MELAWKNGTIYEFDDFRLIPCEELLLRNGEPVPLNAKALRVLVQLVERHGHLVEKSEILDLVWEDSFVEEGSLSKAIWYVRHALNDTSKERFIQTIPKRGYRFICPVSVVNNASGAYRLTDLPEIEEATTDVITGHEMPVTNGNAGEFPVEAVGAEAMASVPSHQVSSPPRSSRMRILMWAAAYAGIGAVLLVGVALFVATNWRDLGNGSSPPDRGTNNAEAYDLYQQAENLSQRRNQENMPIAMGYLNQAVALDPNFAHAWAAKAHLHRYIADYPGADQAEQYKKSMDALGKAIAIDPNLSEAYSALCLNKLRYEYDVAGAEGSCTRALELDPDSSVGRRVYATFLYSRGRHDEAIPEIKRAIDLQPLALEHLQTHALALYYARRFEEEEAQWKRLIELNPTHGYIYTRLFLNAAQQGKDDNAFDYLIKKLTLDKADNETIERFRTAYAVSGWRGVTMERIKNPELESFTGPFDVACLYATIGDKDKAFEFLEKAYQEHSYRIAVLQVEPQLDPLRDDPRYADLVGRVESK